MRIPGGPGELHVERYAAPDVGRDWIGPEAKANRAIGTARSTAYLSLTGSISGEQIKPAAMNHKKIRPRRIAAEPTPFEQARDELFQHIIRCEVSGSHPDHQKEWFDETIAYMADRYHELTAVELADLRTLGERFAKPAKSGQAVSA